VITKSYHADPLNTLEIEIRLRYHNAVLVINLYRKGVNFAKYNLLQEKIYILRDAAQTTDSGNPGTQAPLNPALSHKSKLPRYISLILQPARPVVASKRSSPCTWK